MKFFTSEWWGNNCEDASVFKRYDKYLESVASSLPKNLLLLHSDHTLHDAEVKKITSSFDTKIVNVELRGWDAPLQNPVYYKLQFSGVREFHQVFPQQEYVESELGDLGYWEIEALKHGTEVRMLFVSNAEFRIVFEGFNFEHAPISA
jgi:hypothetical protein